MILLEEPRSRIRLFLGPVERSWFADSPLARLDSSRVETVAEDDLVGVARRLGECRRLVTNDSGLLHLAEAVGTPVVAVFGPTVAAFGYAPLLPDSRLLEADLPCRPCSRMGEAPCRTDDLACLEAVSAEAVHAALTEPGRETP